MSKIAYGDILNIKHGIICHQVNCMGVMGAGLAYHIRYKYPVVFAKYKKYCKEHEPFGTVQPVTINPDLVVCNIFAQKGFSRNHKCTNEDVLIDCIKRVCEHYPNTEIYIPYGIGCGLAGGNWPKVFTGIKDLPITIIKKEI